LPKGRLLFTPGEIAKGGDAVNVRIFPIVVLLAARAVCQQPPEGLPKSPRASENGTKAGKKTNAPQQLQPDSRQATPPVPQRETPPDQLPPADALANREAPEKDSADWWTRAFTFLLVVVGFLQVWILRRQTRIIHGTLKATQDAVVETRRANEVNEALTKESAELTLKALVLTQHPRLTVRNVVIRTPLESGAVSFRKGQPVSGQFYVVNIGGSNATVLESHCVVIGLADTLPMDRPYEGKAGNNPITAGCVLPPAGVWVGMISEPNPFPDFEPMPVVNAQTGITHYPGGVYVMGWLEYSDDNGFIRRTAFCRKYDWDKKRFFAEDDPDYEHAE
jgi:hypothetical protein